MEDRLVPYNAVIVAPQEPNTRRRSYLLPRCLHFEAMENRNFSHVQDNSLRIFCHWLQGHPIMGNFILVCIIISSALLACEDPLRSGSPINQVTEYILYARTRKCSLTSF